MYTETTCEHLKGYFFSYYFFGIFVIFCASAAPQRPTCSLHANPAGSPTRNGMFLQVGEMPDLNPGLLVLQSGALPLSHQRETVVPPDLPHLKCKRIEPKFLAIPGNILNFYIVVFLSNFLINEPCNKIDSCGIVHNIKIKSYGNFL